MIEYTKDELIDRYNETDQLREDILNLQLRVVEMGMSETITSYYLSVAYSSLFQAQQDLDRRIGFAKELGV